MTDPFLALRLPDTAVTPTPAFTDRLRARLERAPVSYTHLTLPTICSV